MTFTNEQMKIYQEQYREKNKQRREERFKCICGGVYTRGNKAQHLKTQKHINYIDNKTSDSD